MFLEVQNNTNDLYLILCGVVVAAEPLVRGLRKLPEDIDWSYSGLYELFPVQGERILSDVCGDVHFATNTAEFHHNLT